MLELKKGAHYRIILKDNLVLNGQFLRIDEDDSYWFYISEDGSDEISFQKQDIHHFETVMIDYTKDDLLSIIESFYPENYRNIELSLHDFLEKIAIQMFINGEIKTINAQIVKKALSDARSVGNFLFSNL